MADTHTSSTEDLVISSLDPFGVQTIYLNRPRDANALSSPLMLRLLEVVESAHADPRVRAIIITGNGPNAFSVGADLVELLECGQSEAIAYLELGHRVLGMIERMGKPSVAAINGDALGGGLELALVCSFRVAVEDSILGLPEVTLGLIPGFGGTQRLPRIIGWPRAQEMILTGKTCAARDALQAGLVSEVTTADNLLKISMMLLERMICHPEGAVSAALAALREKDEAAFEEALARERQLCCRQICSADAKRELARFIRKQKIARFAAKTLP